MEPENLGEIIKHSGNLVITANELRQELAELKAATRIMIRESTTGTINGSFVAPMSHFRKLSRLAAK